jgi:hypothetical protein
MTTDADNQSVLPLDDGLYRLDNADIAFFKKLIGIYNNEEFKTHLLSIQAEAYEVTQFFSLFSPYLNDRKRCAHIPAYASFGGPGMTTLRKGRGEFNLMFIIFQAWDLTSLPLQGLAKTWPGARRCDTPGYWLLL